MRAVLTGATGFLGSRVLRQLVEEGHDVAVLARASSDPWRIGEVLHRCTRIAADLGQLALAREPIKRFRPDAVVHLAWSGVPSSLRNDPRQMENLHATLELVGAAGDAGATHFVGLGSQAEYGPSSGALDESAPTNPTTLYGVTKLSTFHFARHACARRGLRFAWLRLFSAYGASDDPAWMIPSLILQLLAGKRPPLTPGEQRWDYLHVSDAAAAVVRVATDPSAAGLFNLGSGRATPVRAMAQTIRDMIDPDLPLGFGEVPYREDQIMHLQARIERLRALGWAPAITLEDGLRDTVRWYRENCARYAATLLP
jgi:UDP-glucose 4-epimerase